MTDHANELRRYSRKIGHPAGDVPSVMLAAADEIERLAATLEAAEKAVTEAYRRGYETGQEEIEKERDALRASKLPDGLETDLLIVKHAMRMNNWDWNSNASDDLKRSAYKIISKLLVAPEAKP